VSGIALLPTRRTTCNAGGCAQSAEGLPFATITTFAQQLEIPFTVAASSGDWDEMIKFKFLVRATFCALGVIAVPNRVPDCSRYVLAPNRLYAWFVCSQDAFRPGEVSLVLALGLDCLRGGDERQLFFPLSLPPLGVGALLLCAFRFCAVEFSFALPRRPRLGSDPFVLCFASLRLRKLPLVLSKRLPVE
jgi:hypothetical protein